MVQALSNISEEVDEVIIPKRLYITEEPIRSFDNKDKSNFVTPRTKRFFERMQLIIAFLQFDP